MLLEMNPAPPVTRMRFMYLPKFAIDVVDRALLDVALDAGEVFAQHGHDETLQPEHEQHQAAEQQRAREVAVADPEHDPPDPDQAGGEDTSDREDRPHPLHHLRP